MEEFNQNSESIDVPLRKSGWKKNFIIGGVVLLLVLLVVLFLGFSFRYWSPGLKIFYGENISILNRTEDGVFINSNVLFGDVAPCTLVNSEHPLCLDEFIIAGQKTSDGGYIVFSKRSNKLQKLNDKVEIEWENSYGVSGVFTEFFVYETKNNDYLLSWMIGSGKSGDIHYLLVGSEGDKLWEGDFHANRFPYYDSSLTSLNENPFVFELDDGYVFFVYFYQEDESSSGILYNTGIYKINFNGEVEWKRRFSKDSCILVGGDGGENIDVVIHCRDEMLLVNIDDKGELSARNIEEYVDAAGLDRVFLASKFVKVGNKYAFLGKSSAIEEHNKSTRLTSPVKISFQLFDKNFKSLIIKEYEELKGYSHSGVQDFISTDDGGYLVLIDFFDKYGSSSDPIKENPGVLVLKLDVDGEKEWGNVVYLASNHFAFKLSDYILEEKENNYFLYFNKVYDDGDSRVGDKYIYALEIPKDGQFSVLTNFSIKKMLFIDSVKCFFSFRGFGFD